MIKPPSASVLEASFPSSSFFNFFCCNRWNFFVPFFCDCRARRRPAASHRVRILGSTCRTGKPTFNSKLPSPFLHFGMLPLFLHSSKLCFFPSNSSSSLDLCFLQLLDFQKSASEFLQELYRLRPWSSTQFKADRLLRVRADLAPVPELFRFLFLALTPSTFVAAVGLLMVTSSHIAACLSQESWPQHRSSPLCTGIFPGSCGATPFMSPLNPFFEVVSLHCRALCRAFVFSKGSSDTPARGPFFSSLRIPHSHIRHSPRQRRSLRRTAVFHSPFAIPCTGAVSAHLATVCQGSRSLSRVQSCSVSSRACVQ